jgi:Retrotransposon gag protein
LLEDKQDFSLRGFTMNFSGDAEEWFSYFRMEIPDPTWTVLVTAVFERFKERTHLNPCIQFKWVQQTSTVDEYVKDY